MEGIYFGIDIGGYSHRVHFSDQEMRPVCSDLTIADDLEGYQELAWHLAKLKEKYPEAIIHGGAEATGIYWRNLFSFINREAPWVKLSLLNPLQVRRFKDLKLERVKTDSTDARIIARYVATIKPEPQDPVPEHLADLQELCRYRKGMAREHTRYANQLHKYLKLAFPELCGKIKTGSGLRYLAVLARFPTAADIAGARVDRIASIRFGKRNWKVGDAFAREIKAMAKRSAASRTGPGIGFVLVSVAANVLRIRGEMEALEEKIAELYSECPDTPLTTIPGVALLSAAIIESEIKNIARFRTAKKLNGYIGAYPELHESGKFKLSSPKMTKKGNRYLNQTVYMCVLAQVSPHAPDNPIKHHYWRKVAQGEERMVAIGSCMGKLVGLIYGILASGKPFDPDYGFGSGDFDVRFVDRNTGCVVPEEEAVSSNDVVAIRWKRATAPRSDRPQKEVVRPS